MLVLIVIAGLVLTAVTLTVVQESRFYRRQNGTWRGLTAWMLTTGIH